MCKTVTWVYPCRHLHLARLSCDINNKMLCDVIDNDKQVCWTECCCCIERQAGLTMDELVDQSDLKFDTYMLNANVVNAQLASQLAERQYEIRSKLNTKSQFKAPSKSVKSSKSANKESHLPSEFVQMLLKDKIESEAAGMTKERKRKNEARVDMWRRAAAHAEHREYSPEVEDIEAYEMMAAEDADLDYEADEEMDE